MNFPTSSLISKVLTGRDGRPVIKWEVLEFGASDGGEIRFISKNSDWRQGLWLHCGDGFSLAGRVFKSIELWSDNSPANVGFAMPSEGGVLHIYNIWDRGRGRESQSHTSGMQLEINGGLRRYGCNDIGFEPDYSKLIFELQISHRKG